LPLQAARPLQLTGSGWWSIADTFSADSDGDLSAVALIDPVTGQRLHPLHDDAEPDLSEETMTPGGTKVLTATFPAPNGDTADVLVPHFGSFRDVPIH
jgi:hypothetical protein